MQRNRVTLPQIRGSSVRRNLGVKDSALLPDSLVPAWRWLWSGRDLIWFQNLYPQTLDYLAISGTVYMHPVVLMQATD